MVVVQWLMLSLCVRLRRGVDHNRLEMNAVPTASGTSTTARPLSAPNLRTSTASSVPSIDKEEDSHETMKSAWKAILDPSMFWNWPNLETYRMFMTMFTALFLVLHLILGGYAWYLLFFIKEPRFSVKKVH